MILYKIEDIRKLDTESLVELFDETATALIDGQLENQVKGKKVSQDNKWREFIDALEQVIDEREVFSGIHAAS